MRHLNRFFNFFLLASTVFMTAFGGTSLIHAQDMEKVACDADLIRNWYIAEHYFGFGDIMLMVQDMPNADSDTMTLDASHFELGQFAPLFEMDAMAEDEPMMGDMEQLESAMMMSQDELDTMTMTMLPATTIMTDVVLFSQAVPDEDLGCQSLRAELRHFYSALVYTNVMAEMETK